MVSRRRLRVLTMQLGFSILLSMALPASADIAVIGNLRNIMGTLTAKQVQDLFLGRLRSFPNDKFALPIDQSSSLRAAFYQQLTGRSVEQINAYWARIVFTGQSAPPLLLPDDATVLKIVRENEGAIGYIDKLHLDHSVQLFLLLP